MSNKTKTIQFIHSASIGNDSIGRGDIIECGPSQASYLVDGIKFAKEVSMAYAKKCADEQGGVEEGENFLIYARGADLNPIVELSPDPSEEGKKLKSSGNK